MSGGTRHALPYRLSISPSLEKFRPELEFACSFVDNCHPVVRREHGEILLHYGDSPPPGSIHVPSVLFPDCVRLDVDGIHPEHEILTRVARNTSKPTLLPQGVERQRCQGIMDYDALGLIFLMLSRLEERENSETLRDRYGRFPADASIQYRFAGLDIPLADDAAYDVAAFLTGQVDPSSSTAYRVWLTHDVDRIWGYKSLEHLFKNAAGDIIFRRDPINSVKRLWRAATSGEPWRACMNIMNGAERYGFQSRFYFMGPTRHPMDNEYTIRSPDTVRKLAGEILRRGHEVGFHPGAATRGNPEEWLRQKQGLEEVIKRQVHEGRQHGLLFDVDTTWDTWNDAGMEREMTLGYPAPSGFRSGTCRSHQIFSLRDRRVISLRAYPTAIMDFGFFGGRYRDLSVDEAITESQDIIDVCRKHGGDLVVLFHPSDMLPPRTTYFERLLEIL